MSKGLVFGASVSDSGRIVFDDPTRLAVTLKKLASKRIEVVLRKPRSKRSLAANAWWWGVAVPMIAEELGYDRHEYEQVHYALVVKCFGTTHDERLKAEVPAARSSKLSTKEFAELMDWVVRFAAEEWGLILPLPSEVEP
jgi:hypothetical protein